MRYSIPLVAFLFIFTTSFSQRVSNVRASMQGSNVVITYDLEGSSSSDQFNVSLLCDQNNFSQPLKLVTGDVGIGVKPGTDLAITWNARQELVNFTGDIVFEVNATIMPAYYNITNPSSSSKLKKGGKITLSWTGGNPDENVKIDLLKSGREVSTISMSTKNEGTFQWTVPKELNGAKDYQVRITNAAQSSSAGISKTFMIGRKFPITYIIIPGAVIIGAVAYLATRGGGGENNNNKNPPENNSLPLPPDPTQ